MVLVSGLLVLRSWCCLVVCVTASGVYFAVWFDLVVFAMLFGL